jgi:cation:H+ antiporter
MIVQLLIFSASLGFLALASHFTINSLERLIEMTGVSETSAGIVVLAVLTATPEIMVALFSVLEGTPGISVGDVLGSNIFNIGVVIGILGMLGYLTKIRGKLWVKLTDILFATSLIPLLLVISHFHIFDIATPVVGAILLGIFFVNTCLVAKEGFSAVKENGPPNRTGNIIKVVAVLLLSLAGVLVSARLVVYSGINIAILLGVPPILIGAKLVSIGTSLPELTLDLTAVRHGRIQLALGDIIGSNLTNLTLVLGLVLIASPAAVDMTILGELLPFMLITTIIFWRSLLKGEVSQVGGIILVLTYILFQAVIS